MYVENAIAFPYRKMEYVQRYLLSQLQHSEEARYVGYTPNLAPICLIIIDDVVPFTSIICSPWKQRNSFSHGEGKTIPVMFAPHINDVLMLQPQEAYVVNLEDRIVSKESLEWIKNNSLAVEFRSGQNLLFVRKIAFNSVSQVAEFNLRIS